MKINDESQARSGQSGGSGQFPVGRSGLWAGRAGVWPNFFFFFKRQAAFVTGGPLWLLPNRLCFY